MIHPLIIKESDTKLVIAGDEYEKLMKKPKAILWCRAGLYGMIPIEVVKNAIQLLRDFNKSYVEFIPRQFLEFSWSETVEVPPDTGRSMEKYNGNNIK
jgi:hypothetical protein